MRLTREHSCDLTALNAHLQKALPGVRATFEALSMLLDSIGPHELIPLKTMVCVRVVRNFAGLVFGRAFLDVSFFLPREMAHERVRGVERIGPRSIAHRVRLTSPADVDDTLSNWLREAYQLGARV